VRLISREKYDPPDPRRMYTIMSSEEAANGKKSNWAELEISGKVKSLSTALWSLTHLTALHLSDNSLSRIPPDIAKLHNLVYLDLSSNKIRSLPAELGNMVSLRELLLNNNLLRVLPFELGKLFQLQTLGLKGKKTENQTVQNKLKNICLHKCIFLYVNFYFRFNLVQKHTVEFNQLAMANSEGSEPMLNRVMTKDNIGVAVLLELRKELMELSSGKPLHGIERQLILVANAHMHWDPEYSDVKLVQTMMFLSEVKNIIDKASRSLKLSSVSGETNAIPLVLCADLNSLPDSGVVEYLTTGGVDITHKDFKELRYSDCLTNFNCNGKNGTSNGRITHGFKLKSAYENGLMPYTNYTFDFKGVIDYIFYSKPQLNVLGILGPLDHHWLIENNISGCPHPHIPSDHFSLFAQLELVLPHLPSVNGVHLPGRR
uniref:poly(A)-specific ribonuclease n=1 Tax=Erpetoichthys calabaricus TaxID=27687 RepID=A0A8C4XFY0_ERPCA